jgi:hypothetical protein
MTLTADSPTVNLGTVLANTDATATSVLTVATTNATGYTLTATDQNDAWAMRDAALDQLLDAPASCSAPAAWAAGAASGFGISVLGATGGAASRLAKWGTGTNTAANDFTNNLWCGLRSGTTATQHQRAGFFAGSDTVTVAYRGDVPTSQVPSAYSGIVTYTATANP